MTSTTASDPVCGMQVNPEKAVAVEYGGHVYYFCESAWADTFRDDPGRWIRRDTLVEA